jgi:hypothetical protein
MRDLDAIRRRWSLIDPVEVPKSLRICFLSPLISALHSISVSSALVLDSLFLVALQCVRLNTPVRGHKREERCKERERERERETLSLCHLVTFARFVTRDVVTAIHLFEVLPVGRYVVPMGNSNDFSVADHPPEGLPNEVLSHVTKIGDFLGAKRLRDLCEVVQDCHNGGARFGPVNLFRVS